jgi:Mg-chelatase subunit ChlD
MNFEVSEILVNNVPIKGVKILGNKLEQGQRNATHTIILLDVSGSMEEDKKLTNVKKSLNFLIKFLQPNDRLTLITFNSMSQIQIQNINVTPEYLSTFQHVIDTIQAYGGTNLSSGLLNVKSVLERCNASSENSNISKTGLVILTDGHANEGLTSSNDILRIVESIKTTLPSLTITTIGYNEDHNAELLKSIAVNGGGSYNIVNTNDQVATVFGEILGGLMTTVVQNCYVKYDSSWKNLNMYTRSENNGQTILNIGDINAESETIILFTNTNNCNLTVKVTGVTTKDFTTITQELNFNQISENKQPYHMTYIRLVIANILQNLKTLSKEYIKETLNPMKEYLEQPMNILHPLTSYLKQEISSIENQLETPSCVNTTQNLQQSICMAFGRGTSCARNVQPVFRTPPRTPATARRAIRFENVDVDNMLNNAMNNMNVSLLATPFANSAQREVSQYAVNYTQATDITESSDPDVEC